MLSLLLWAILANYLICKGTGNPQTIVSWSGAWVVLESLEPMAGVQREESFVEDFALNLWSLCQLWVVNIRIAF